MDTVDNKVRTTPAKYNAVKGLINQQEKDRGKPYTDKQKKFLTMLVKNNFKNPTELMKKAGYNVSSYAIISSLKEDIKALAEAILLSNTPYAATFMGELLTSEDRVANAGARLTAAKEILDRVGITKEDRVKHQHEHTGGIFIIPAKTSAEVIEGEYTNV